MARSQARKRHGFLWWLVRGLGVLVGLIIIVLAGGYFWLRSSLPTVDGTIEIAGLDGPVEVVRDADAVPHIFAGTARDAYFTMGFVHAQDRLWQMEFQRRIGAGRLSEVMGERTLSIDKFLRTVGVYRIAEQNYAALDAQAKGAYDAYAAGVNAYLAQHSGAWPLEFVVLGHTPEPWRPADSLVWIKMMAWDLAGNFRDELMRAELAKRLSPAKIAQLWPPYPADGPVALEAALSPPELPTLPWHEMLAALPPAPPAGMGSNNWVLSGRHTESGMPLLANDPHLGLSVPSLWYLAHLSAPGLEIIGATLPGLPAPVLGRNKNFAWGFTNTNPDVQDLFIERIDPGDPAKYLTPAGSEAFTTREETIRVKDGQDVVLNVRETRHGPVISDVLGEAGAIAESGHVVAFAWTALDPGDASAGALSRVAVAEDWDGFVGALRGLKAPQQNIVFADRFGNIGLISPARVPIRAEGRGRTPVPGWTGAHDWQADVPFSALPRLFNPGSGRIVTANNRIVGEGYPYFITDDWAPPFRAQRIHALLSASETHSPESFAAIQRDFRSLGADRLLPSLLSFASPTSDAGVDALRRLTTWDRVMAPDAAEPLIYMAWGRYLMRRLFADELGDAFEGFWSIRIETMYQALNTNPAWCDDVTTEAREDCGATVSAALEDALGYLNQRYGATPENWRWGEAHHIHAQHRILGQIPGIGPLFEIDMPNGGEKDTVNAGGFTLSNEADPFAQIHGPGYRAIYDLGNLGNSRFIQSTGQSGNPLSAHYDDFAERWRDGVYVPMRTARRAIESDALGTLILKPAP